MWNPAAEMYEQAMLNYPTTDAAILCAAVADFTPDSVADKKIKREGEELILHLKPTHDIAAALGTNEKNGTETDWFCPRNQQRTRARQRQTGPEELRLYRAQLIERCRSRIPSRYQ